MPIAMHVIKFSHGLERAYDAAGFANATRTRPVREEMETTGLAPISLYGWSKLRQAVGERHAKMMGHIRPGGSMRQALFMLLASAAVVGSAYAHHSFAQYYFEDRSVTVEGEIVRFEYQSPHAWVYLDAKDEQGITRQYGAEWANPNRLTRDNITRDTLKVGDHVVISGSPGKQPEEHKVHLKRIRRPSDGWTWPPSRRP